MSKVKATRNFLYGGIAYKKNEVFEVVGYAFTWLAKNKCVEKIDDGAKTAPDLPAADDDLIATEGLPALDEVPKRGKKNG